MAPVGLSDQLLSNDFSQIGQIASKSLLSALPVVTEIIAVRLPGGAEATLDGPGFDVTSFGGRFTATIGF